MSSTPDQLLAFAKLRHRRLVSSLGSGVKQAAVQSRCGGRSSRSFAECRRKCFGGPSRRTNVSKAHRVFVADSLNCWIDLVDLIGIEPMTSSMPWNELN